MSAGWIGGIFLVGRRYILYRFSLSLALWAGRGGFCVECGNESEMGMWWVCLDMERYGLC